MKNVDHKGLWQLCRQQEPSPYGHDLVIQASIILNIRSRRTGGCYRQYTLSHRECGQLCPYVHENFEKFKIISTPTGSWIRSRQARSNPTARRGRNYLEFFKIFMNIGTELSTLSMGQSIVKFFSWWEIRLLILTHHSGVRYGRLLIRVLEINGRIINCNARMNNCAGTDSNRTPGVVIQWGFSVGSNLNGKFSLDLRREIFDKIWDDVDSDGQLDGQTTPTSSQIFDLHDNWPGCRII